MASKMLVYVPGLQRRKGKRFVERLQTAAADAGFTFFEYRHGVRAWSLRRSLKDVVTELAAFISNNSGDELGANGGEIRIVAHSFGGLIARAAYLEDVRGRSEQPAPWVTRVERIVLLGVPNAGFNLSHRWWWRQLYRISSPLFPLAIEHIHVGAFWITNLRLMWLDAFRRTLPQTPPVESPPGNEQGTPASESHGALIPMIIQVIGSKDGLVTEEQISDDAYLVESYRARLSGADHDGLVQLPKEGAEQRWEILKAMILKPVTESEDVKSAQSATPKTEHVPFILHGIRSNSNEGWVERLANYLNKSPNTKATKFEYGWLSAIEFATRRKRNLNVHDFLTIYGDRYASHDPNNFTFFGHSNGTYMLAQCMFHVPAMRFVRIMLASTVIHPAFDWNRLFKRKQIGYWEGSTWQPGAIHSDSALRDWPVGFLCSVLSGLSWWRREVGPGGVLGFEQVTGDLQVHPSVFIKGHAATVEMSEARMEGVRAFLAEGRSVDSPAGRGQSTAFSGFCRFIWRGIIPLSLLLLGGLIYVVGWLSMFVWWWWLVPAGILALLLVVYLRARFW